MKQYVYNCCEMENVTEENIHLIYNWIIAVLDVSNFTSLQLDFINQAFDKNYCIHLSEIMTAYKGCFIKLISYPLHEYADTSDGARVDA